MGEMFINPYTYVPIRKEEPERAKDGTEKEREADRTSEKERLSGCIYCNLKIHSNTFIPNTTKKFHYLKDIRLNKSMKNYERLKNQFSEHYFLDFYSYEDLSEKKDAVPKEGSSYPRIPGSEIRGMIRSIYEQLTNSCFSVIDEETILSKRTSLPKLPGYVDMDNKILYKGERLMLNTGINDQNYGERVYYDGEDEKGRKVFHTGDRVFVKRTKNTYVKHYYNKKKRRTEEYDTGFYMVSKIEKAEEHPDLKEDKAYEEGIVLIGEGISGKHHDTVILLSEEKEEIGVIDDATFQRLKKLLEIYKEFSGGKKINGQGAHKCYEKFFRSLQKAKRGLLPIFYSKVGAVLYLSPSMITREVFSYTIADILEKNEKHEPCDGREGWCPACRLFGMMGKRKNAKSIASRLRFLDSDPFSEPVYAEPKILPILGGPNFMATEFTLEKTDPGATMWNYDYYMINRKTKSYIPKLRGRKVYWLGKDGFEGEAAIRCPSVSDAEMNIKEWEEKNINMKIACRPLSGMKNNTYGNATTFQVFFEELTEEELQKLSFCLYLGGKEGTYHRIGRGKPYGMGAVKIEIEDITLRKYVFSDGRVRAVEEHLKDNTQEFMKYTRLNEEENDSFYTEHKKAIKEILAYSTELSKKEGDLVAYPALTEGGDIRKWFTENRGKVGKERIKQILPELLKDKRLYRKSDY